jgi:putative aldouronate transport system substrate-binding protein
MTIFQTLDDYISSSSIATFPWAIPRNTADPAAAMTYLNMLYTNADLMNLISWGIEGKHYEVQSNGLIDFPAGVDASNSGYNHGMGWMFPNQFLTHVWVGNDPGLWDQIRAFNRDAQKSSALGFSFDSSSVATEWTAVQNIYNEYWQSLEFGMVDPSTAIPEMISRMQTAGLQKIIDAKQAQLDKWASDMGLS